MKTPRERTFKAGPFQLGLKTGITGEPFQFRVGWYDCNLGSGDDAIREHYFGGFLRLFSMSLSLYVTLWGNGDEVYPRPWSRA